MRRSRREPTCSWLFYASNCRERERTAPHVTLRLFLSRWPILGLLEKARSENEKRMRLFLSRTVLKPLAAFRPKIDAGPNP
jgi:hypothetical protein